MTPLVFAEIPFPGIDPVAIRLGPLAVRWYGLGYLAGFLVAGWLLDRLVRDGFLPLTKTAVSDLIGWLVLGVIVGGRLGYAAFYEPAMFLDPPALLQVWRGGLSFHGGLAGVVAASVVFAGRRRVPWGRLADGLALAATPGILLVRCANFVNGELYGRLAPDWLPWGVRFPTDPAAFRASPELAAGGSLGWHGPFAALRESGEWARIAEQVPLRHPSQLYEALLEGLLLGIALWTVYVRLVRPRVAGGGSAGGGGGAWSRAGALAALFLVGYAATRFLVEFTRQPDPQFQGAGDPLGTVLGPLTMGQLLTLAVAAAGVLLLVRNARTAERGRGPAPGL